jgi:Zn-dependent protease
MDASFLVNGVVWYANLLLAMTFHEAAHAYAAYLGGDRTAYMGGQVSLDPRPHIQRERFGMVIFPILSYFFHNGQWMMGWASAPYDPTWARIHPRRAAWMATAGPAANLALALFAWVALRIGLEAGVFLPKASSLAAVVGSTGGIYASLVPILSIMMSLNVILCVFNLIPLPPLDGSAILTLFLPVDLADKYQDAMSQPFFNIIGLVLAWELSAYVITPAIVFAIGVLHVGL